MPWSNVTATDPTWVRLSAGSDSNYTEYAVGVDFELHVDDQFPLLVNDSRPLFVPPENMESP